MINKLSILTTLLNTKLKKTREIGSNVELLELPFSGLAAMESPTEESVKFSFVLASFSTFTELDLVMASVDTLLKTAATRDYVSMLFMEEST